MGCLFTAATRDSAAFAVIAATLFMIYIGAAVAVALFHPNEKCRRGAQRVLQQLLGALRGAPKKARRRIRGSRARAALTKGKNTTARQPPDSS